MVYYPTPSDRDFDIVIPIFSGIAFLATFIRVWDRVRTRHFGLDDVFAILGAAFHTMFLTSFFLFLQFPGTPSVSQGVATYYLLVFSFPGALWCSRISILLSVKRIAPYEHQRQRLNLFIFIFLLFWLLLVIQPFWICESNTEWKTSGTRPQCDLGTQRAAFELTFDIIGDTAILVPPLSFLWKLRLQRGLRLRLIFLFSTSVFITIVSIVHDVIVSQVGGLQELFAALLQDCVALTVCNLTVLVTACFRTGRKDAVISTDEDLPAEGSNRMGSKNKANPSGVGSVLTWIGAKALDPEANDPNDSEHVQDDDDVALEDMTKRSQVSQSESSSVTGLPYNEVKGQPFQGFSWQDAGQPRNPAPVSFSEPVVVSREVRIEERSEHVSQRL